MESELIQRNSGADLAVKYTSQPLAPSVADYLAIASRRKWSFILPAAIILIIAVAVALLLPPVYRATSTILIEEQEIPADFVVATVTSFAEQRLQQINQRIMSTSRLMEIIEEYDLYKEMRAKRTSEEVIEQMRQDVQLNQISAEVVDRRTGRPTAATIAFTLSYEGKDSPAKVQRVANVLTSLFLKENLAVRERQTSETSKFLEEEMQRVKQDLAETERTLSEFKEKHINSLPEMLQVNMQGLSTSERSIERLDEQLRSLKEREGYLHTQLANLSPYMENSDRQRLELLETELVALQTRFSDEHPDVIKAKAEITALKKKMAENGDQADVDAGEPDNPAYVTLASQLASTRSEIRSVSNQIGELRKEKTKYEMRVEETPKVEREYQVLTAEQMNLKAKYNDLMQKHMEAVVAMGLEKGQKGERFTLIDPPQLPEKPFKPNRLAIALIGVVLGIGAGVGWAALREFGDQAVYNSERLAIGCGFPVLGEVPAIMTSAERRRLRVRRMVIIALVGVALIGGIVLFHYMVMDWWVFWAKLNRRLVL